MIRKIIILSTACLLSISVHAQEIYTLEKCKELALQNNAKSQNSQLSIEAAEQVKKEAFTKYFPSVSAVGMGFRAGKPMMSMDLDVSSIMAPMLDALGPAIGWMMQMGAPIDPSAFQSEPQKIEMLEKGVIAAVTATQPVYAGGQIVTGNRLAKLGVEVAQLQKAMNDDELLIAVEQFYWQIVALEEKVKTIAEAENLLNRAHSDVKNAVEAGLVNRNDLLKVELKQNELESGKLKVANGLRLSEMVLAQFVGVPAEGFAIDKTLAENLPTPVEVRADHQSSLYQRTEYQLLDKNIEANKMQVKMKTGENLPMVAVGAGWNYFSFDKGGLMPMKNDFGMVFGTVAVPISNWWGGSHAVKKQKLQVQIAENDKRNAEEMLLIQMQQLWNELEEAYAQMQLAGRGVDTALENVRLSDDYYHAGTGLLTELLDAQNSLQQARDQHTEAATGYRMKLSKYRQATGQR
jgi:outer membrane protein TolC